MPVLFKGAAFACVTVLIWSGWNIISRMGTLGALSAADITFLRFAVAGVIALPIVWHGRAILKAAPSRLLALMAIGAGAPYVYIASVGFETAPAGHGVLIPGAMVLWVAVLSSLLLGEQIARARIAGYLLIAASILFRLWSHSRHDLSLLLADGWFLGASLLWATYTISQKQAGLPPLLAASWVALTGCIGFCLPYLALYAGELSQLPARPVVMQMLYQGVLVSFGALLCYNRAMALIGASRASAFAALIPVTTSLLAIPLLGEIPRLHDWLFIAMLSCGVLLATGVAGHLLTRRPPAQPAAL